MPVGLETQSATPPDTTRSPEFRVTVIATGLLAAAIAVGNAMGIAVDEQYSNLLIALYGGAVLASLMCLGAWTGLRDGSLMDRVPVPLLLVLTVISADLIGHRLNSTPPSPISVAVGFLTVYTVVSIVFSIARRLGWRLVHTDYETSSAISFSLAGLMGWIGAFAILLSAAGWTVGSIDFSDISHQFTSGIGAGMVFAVLAVFLAAPVFALVFGGQRNRNRIIVSMMVVLFGLGFVGATTLESGGLFFALPVAVLIGFWLMRAYASIGYRFQHATPTQQSSPTFMVGAAALLIVTIFIGTSMSPTRADRQLKAQWRNRGINPVTLSGDAVVFAAFDHDMPVTRRGTELLQDQTKLTMIQIEDDVTPEQIDWLMELPSLKTLILQGPFVNDEHLERLHDAPHLEEIVYSRIGAKPRAIDTLKRKLAPDVTVRDMWAPRPPVTVPATVTIRNNSTR